MKFQGDPKTSTLLELKFWLREQTKDAKKSAECPCCTQDVRVWPRKLNSGMARSAIIIYRSTKPGEWFDVGALPKKQKLDLHHWEYSKLRFWGILEEQVASGRPNSLWRLTPLGRTFVENKVRLQQKVWVYDNEALGRKDKKTTSITEALGVKFNFDSLMRGEGG
jgi:hypothetical protein